ncbi:MAG: EAL domain-containing protein [Burkholderiaceae bacterium]|nr:EAL domain-containing protein [Burkholderiaceae bacterium]
MSARLEVPTAEILIVDDVSTEAKQFSDALADALSRQGHAVRCAAGGNGALVEIGRVKPDLILLSCSAPDAGEFCAGIKAMSEFVGIPVIFLSDSDDVQKKLHAFEVGCADYLVKPVSPDEVCARVRLQLKQKRERDLLGFRAGHDALTGLPNRNLLVDRLRQAISYAERYERRVAVAYIDLDKFKFVNDTLGHEAGDQLLVEVSQRLQACVRESDTVARLGGDEFAIVLYDQATEDVTMHAMQRILQSIAEPIQVDGGEIRTTCSIGFSFYPQDGRDVDTLLKNADAAMYRAKELGRNNFQFFTEDLTERINQRVALERSLHGALERREFFLHYQPRVDLRTGRVAGVEALLRWDHPEHGVIEPLRFIPLAEEIGMMPRIGHWVMRTACLQMKAWQKEKIAALPMAVNIAGAQFLQPDFVPQVQAVLGETGIDPHNLELEISEAQAMQDPVTTIRVLHELKDIGVRLVVDDFGSGYTNLNFLKQLPLDQIKLHQSFVRDIPHNPEDLAISDAVISMAHSLNLRVTAEGVESEGQMALLAEHGCDDFQGFYFSAPLSGEECGAMLREQRSVPLEKLGREHATRTLLLVDDEQHVLSALARTLHGHDYHILKAQSGPAALELLATHEVGVIICDQRMPDMSGVELFRRIRQMYPHTVRIILSGFADVGIVTDAINVGAVFKFLNKPWDKTQLCDIIEDAFEVYESDTGTGWQPANRLPV